MTTNSTDYRRDLEDIRDRLDWAVGGIDALDNIEERLATIEEDQAELRASFNRLADTLDKLCEAYNRFADRFPPTIANLVEQLTKPCPPFGGAFNQVFSKATAAPAPATKAKRGKPHKPKLAVVPTDSTADGSAHDNGPPKGAA
jgi:hypothetical protein